MASPFSNNICVVLVFQNSMVHIEFQGSRLNRRAARLIPDEHESGTEFATKLWGDKPYCLCFDDVTVFTQP